MAVNVAATTLLALMVILALVTPVVATPVTPTSSLSTTSHPGNIFTYADAYHRSNATASFIADYVNSTGLNWNQEFEPIPVEGGGELSFPDSKSGKMLSRSHESDWLVAGFFQPNCQGDLDPTMTWHRPCNQPPSAGECFRRGNMLFPIFPMKSMHLRLGCINPLALGTLYEWRLYYLNTFCVSGLLLGYRSMDVTAQGCQTLDIFSWEVASRFNAERPGVGAHGSHDFYTDSNSTDTDSIDSP